jgi:Flp pilus assembly pilin Flp
MGIWWAISKQFIRDERGSVAIEYGLIVTVVSMAVMTSIGAVAENLTGTFASLGEAMSADGGGASAFSAPPSGVYGE